MYIHSRILFRFKKERNPVSYGKIDEPRGQNIACPPSHVEVKTLTL
jgi:hypothetical protein